MPKNKPHKGLLKRIRLTKSGKVRLRRAGGRHLRSHKTGKLRRDYLRPKYAAPGEMRRIGRMLFIPNPSRTDAATSTDDQS
ncbi:MAG: large ribosomal subunit protein bL35 [Planctomycetota bacterium]|jgi:large subunit ribosomal protein L35